MNLPDVLTWRGRSDGMARTVALGAAVGRACRPGDLIALVGELAAGKTQLVRGLARGLGLDERLVSSPTFVMVQEYTAEASTQASAPGKPEKQTPTGFHKAAAVGCGPIEPPHAARDEHPPVLVHVDAYRITTLEQLESIGWDPSTLLPGGEMRRHAVVAVEWADRLAELADAEHLRIELTHTGQQQRDVTLIGRGRWAPRLAAIRADLQAALEAALDRRRPCPICAKPVAEDDQHAPFCSSRCRQIDLGNWLTGQYLITRPLEQADFDEP